MKISTKKSIAIALVMFGLVFCLGATELLFENSDFEKGNLDNWTTTGTAFKYQPLKGDYLKARTRFKGSNQQGTYWIGTYEKCTDPNREPYRNVQNDVPMGTLTSIPFEIKGETISFLLGGGLYKQPEGIYVALLIDNREVLKTEKGRNNEPMAMVSWDVSAFKGKKAQILVSDKYDRGWGHINVDYFHYGEPGSTQTVQTGEKTKPAAPASPKSAATPSTTDTSAKQESEDDYIFGSGAEYPKELKDIVPQYPNTTVVSANKSEREQNCQLHQKNGDKKKAVEFYKKEVPKTGWKLDRESNFLSSIGLEFIKGDQKLIIVSRYLGEKHLVITLALTKK